MDNVAFCQAREPLGELPEFLSDENEDLSL